VGECYFFVIELKSMELKKKKESASASRRPLLNSFWFNKTVAA